MLLSPIHCCDVTKPPYLLSGELCTSPLHYNHLFVYTVCCRRRGQCFSVLRTRHTDVVGDSSGRSYVTEQWHNVPFLRTRVLTITSSVAIHSFKWMSLNVSQVHVFGIVSIYWYNSSNVRWSLSDGVVTPKCEKNCGWSRSAGSFESNLLYYFGKLTMNNLYLKLYRV